MKISLFLAFICLFSHQSYALDCENQAPVKCTTSTTGDYIHDGFQISLDQDQDGLWVTARKVDGYLVQTLPESLVKSTGRGTKCTYSNANLRLTVEMSAKTQGWSAGKIALKLKSGKYNGGVWCR